MSNVFRVLAARACLYGPLDHLPMWCHANRLFVAIEPVVCRRTMNVWPLVLRVLDKGEDQAVWVARLIEAVHDPELRIQQGNELKGFPSFTEFHAIADLASAIGKQSDDWRKRFATP